MAARAEQKIHRVQGMCVEAEHLRYAMVRGVGDTLPSVLAMAVPKCFTPIADKEHSVKLSGVKLQRMHLFRRDNSKPWDEYCIRKYCKVNSEQVSPST